MATSTISTELANELIQFLDGELEFLAQLEDSVAELSAQPVGQSFSNSIIERLVAIQKANSVQRALQAHLQQKLADEIRKTPSAVRLSAINAGAQFGQQLQICRREVHQRALTLKIHLRTVLAQLAESNTVVAAVLDAILGAAVDRSRYDARGKKVAIVSPVRGQRIA